MYHKASVPKNFAKLTVKYLCGSLFSTKLQVCIVQLFLRKRLWYRCFLMNSKRYLRHLFHRTPPSDSFCSTEKYFTNTIVKSPLKKEKKKNGNSWWEKQRHTQKKLEHFKNFVIPLFSASHDIIENTSF